MNKSKLLASATAIILALIITVSAVPICFADQDTDDELVPVLERPWDDGTRDAMLWWLRVIPVTGTVVGIYDYYNQDGRLPVPAGSDDTVKEFARNLDALRSAEQQYNLLMVASDLVRNDTQTWKLTDAYLNRAAEISAGTIWYENAVFNADEILEYAGVYNAISTGNMNTADVLNQAVKVSADLRSKWDATNYGQALDIKMVWDGGNTGNASSSLYADFLTVVNSTATDNIVYMSESETGPVIWAYTHQGSITPLAGGDSVALSKGANDVSGLAAGFYKLTPGIFGGSFLPSVSANGAATEGGMGIICDDKYGYVISDEDKVKIFWDGQTKTSSTLDSVITGGDDPQTSRGSPFALVQSYCGYIDQLTTLLYESAGAAQTMWTISAQTHASNILLSPSAIIPHLSNVEITPEQSYAMYILALDQIGQYNATYGSILRDGMTKISAKSLELYCHGSIHSSDGTVIAENVIFTPYVYLRDWSIFSGKHNTFGQDGLIMIWDIADSAEGWVMPADTDYQSILVQKGAYIVPDEIYYKGEEVNSVHLDVKELERIDVFNELDFGRADAPEVLDAAVLIMIIVIEFGMIIALIGYIVRMPGLIAIGGIVALVGFFASGWIAQFLLGRI